MPLRSHAHTSPPTPRQLKRRRYEDWRVDYEVGRWDPHLGRLVKRPISLIAALAGVPERTVRHGIQTAKLVLEIAAVAET